MHNHDWPCPPLQDAKNCVPTFISIYNISSISFYFLLLPLFTLFTLLMERMHINEAVRVYNKTRQTFYNWIKRGYLKSKKINGKVYVWVADAEQLVNDYIAPEGYHPHKNSEQEIIIQWDESDDENDQLHLLDEMIHEIQMSKYELQQKIDTSKQDAKDEIILTKQELRQDMQRIAQWMQQTISISAEWVEKKASESFKTLFGRLETIAHQNALHRFWIYYGLFVFINLLLLVIVA